jgi:Membrane proteins related to metalloendopeptidases
VASIKAQIDILLTGQRNVNNLLGQLNEVNAVVTEIESKWKVASAALQRTQIRLGVRGTQLPRGEKGRFAQDPDRQARLNALADRRAAVERLSRARAELIYETRNSILRGNAIRGQIEGNERILRQAERRITVQQRLNSAVELFETRQQKLARGGGGRGLSQGLQEQAREIQAAFQAAGGGASRNLALINSLATGLGRIVERQNEFNRAQALGSKGFEAGRKLQERLDVVAERGVVPSQRINRLRRGAARVIATSESGDQQAYSEAVRAATAAISRVERESKKLAGNLAKNATRSPILGGTNFPGSPKAVEAQRRAQELALRQSQKGYPASPILGTAAMAGSPRATQAQKRAQEAADRTLRAQERAAKVAETAADKALKESQKGFPSSPLLGAAGMAGSPKALQAQERNRAAVERRIATQRRAEERAAKLQQQAAAAAERAADRALKEAQEGYPSSPVLGGASMSGSPRWKTAQESAKRKAEAAARATERAADKAIAEAQKGYPASPILGSATMAGSPRALQAQERARAAADRALRAQERAAKVAETAADKALTQAQKGYPASPILGTATMAGSPRWKAAQERLAGKAGGTAGSGLQEALQSLQEARGARERFFGGASPAEAIDKIVREFNTGKPVAQNLASTFAQNIQSGSGEMAKAATSAFATVKNAIEKVWKINSPSGVIIEIVKNIVSTFIAEVLAAGPSVRSAVEDTFNSKGIDRDYGDIGTRNPRTPGPAFGLDPNVALRLGGGRVTGGYPPVSGIFAPGSTPPIGGYGSGYPFFPPYQMTGTKRLPTPGMAGAQFPVDPMVDLRRNRPEDTSKVVTERIKQFRVDRDNFWQDRDLESKDFWATEFDAVSRALKSGAQLSLARLARRLQQSKALTPDQEFKQVAGEAKSLLSAGSGPGASGVSRSVGSVLQRISDSVLNSVEALGFSVGNSFEDGIDRIRGGVSSAVSRGLSAFSGFDGGFGGPRPPAGGLPGGAGGGGQGGQAQQAANLLGLDALGDVSRLSTRELETLSATLSELRAVLDPTIQGFDRLDNQLRETIGNIGRQLERRAPDADFLTRRVGPRAGRAVSEGLIGGAFPLLFGQGIGASAGGLAGGVAGGFAGGGLGFGLSLIGTALGTVFDTLNQAAQDTGKAFNYPIEGFEALKTAGLFASRQQEYYISKLIETGQTSRATAEIQAEMIKKIGVSGVNDLMELGDSSTRLSKAWAEFNLQLQAALAGPMTGLLDWVASVVALSTGNVQKEAQSIDPRAFSRAQEEANRIAQQGKPFFSDQDRTAYEKELNRLSQEIIAKTGVPLVKQTKQDPAQEVADLDKAIEKTDKARSLIQQGVALERSGVDLRLSVEDTVYGLRKRATDMEREAIEFRRSVEDQIFGKRQELEQKLIENERKRQQNAIDAFDLQLQQASAGLDPIAQGVVDAARDYLRIRAEGEADLQQAEKQLKLELQQIDQEVNRYKLQVEDRVSQMAIQRDEFSRDVSRARLQIERQIADRVVQVEEYRLAMAKHRYEMEIDLEKKKQIVAQQGLAVQATGGYTGDKVDGFPIASRPGMRWGRMHRGVDVAAPTGTALGYEIGGKILSTGWIEGYGNTLKVELENGMTVLSAHLNEIFVTAGQKFQSNQRLATVGSTGNSTGPHTHQESWMNGKADPYASLPFLQLGKAVSGKPGAGSDPDIYLQPGVGYFSRKTGRMVRGLTGGVGQAASAGASAQAASGAVGAAPVLQAAPAMPVLPSAPQLVGINDLMQQYVEIVKKIKAATAETNKIEIESNAIAAERARLALQEQAMSSVRQAEQQTREIYEEIEARKLRNRLALEGFAPEIIEGEIRVLNLRRDLAKAVKGYDIVLSELIGTTYDGTTSTYESAVSKVSELEALGELTPAQKALREELEKILKARQGIRDATPGAIKGAKGAAEASIMSPREKIEGRIGELKKEIAELTNIGNLSIKVADGIGNAFGQAFQGLISGSMSAREALAGFFKSVAESFLSMAAEIIAKQMTMIVLQTILQALGAVSGASSVGKSATNYGGAPGVKFNPGAFKMPALAANGATFSNGIAQFARGDTFTNSIVSSPTLFQFADGGVTRMGEMGEAGPEAIMPLKRGPDGRLGVDASGMAVPYRRPAAAAATPEMEVPYQRGGSALAVPYLRSEGNAADDSMNATIDVKFETVRIGGVDYVTRDEAEQIGRESAQRGAELAHKRYRNSPSARRAVGMG